MGDIVREDSSRTDGAPAVTTPRSATVRSATFRSATVRSVTPRVGHQPLDQGHLGELEPGVDTEPLHQRRDVRLGGPLGDPQPLGDLTVRQIAEQQREHLALPVAERADPLGGGPQHAQRVLNGPFVHGRHLKSPEFA